MIAKMAWRNMWRNKRRTLITLASIVFGLFLAVTFTSLKQASWGKMIDGSAKMSSGHVTIEPKGYLDAPSTDLFLPNANQLSVQAGRLPGVDRANVRILGNAMASTASGSAGVALYGIDPESEKDMLTFIKRIKEGGPLSGNTGNEALIGAGLAEQLDLKVGSKLVITSTDKEGEVVSGLVRVKGIFRTGVPGTDRGLLAVPIGWARSFLGYGEAGGTLVAIVLKDRRATDDATESLSSLALLQGGVALPWYKTMPELSTFLVMNKGTVFILQVFIFILIGAGILNTVLMGVLERFHELGIMRAVGMSPWRLWRLVMAECLFLAVLGITAGLVVTMPVYAYLNLRGFDISGLFTQTATVANVAIDTRMNAEIYPETLAGILSLVLLLILSTGFYPAFVASRIKALDAIRQI